MRKRIQQLSNISQLSSQDESFFVKGEIKIPKIVITGGPASGKSTAVRHLNAVAPELHTVAEAATQVLSSGFPVPTDERPWSQAWQNGLQRAIVGHQLGLEEIADEDARQANAAGIVLDRGLMDGASYLAGGIGEFEELSGLAEADILGRYDAVIYLGWLTTRQYSNESNPTRFEDEADARQLSAKVLTVWANHPNLIEIHDQDQRSQAVASTIQYLLTS